MMKLIFRETYFLLFTTLLITSVFHVSCSTSDDDNGGADGSNYKITVTLNDVNETDDFISIVAIGGNVSENNNSPMWRVNNQDRPGGVQSVSLGDNDFTGGNATYILETINPINILTMGVQIINYGENLTGNFRIEKNGTTQVNETINLMGDNTDFTENYSFNNQ